ncbi:MAG: cellulase family glycosylhydrolase [Candidatus Binatia bacterium]
MNRHRTIATGLLAVLALAIAPASAATPGATAGRVHRAGRWLVDGQGRVVVAHGFNVVRKVAPFVRTEFGDADAQLLANEGFTVVRIGFIWEGVEPQPGRYDDAYVERVLALDDLLARHGIRTLVDFHQDLWSRGTFGDGAPAWATLGANFNDAFAAFWRDDAGPSGVGIQTHFVRAWHHVARQLRRHRNVLGLDPLNEAYPGSDYPPPCGPFTRCPAFESAPLATFYRRVIRAIRAGGAAHPIFAEGVADSGAAPPALPGFRDRQTAFTYHFYCLATQLSGAEVAVGTPSPEAETCAPIESRQLGNFAQYADQLGVPGFLGEFSCNDVNPDNAQVVDLVGQRFTSWTVWAYYNGADDPADCPRQGLLRDDTQPPTGSNVKQAKLDALAVPYAAAIAGTPEGTTLDRTTRTYTLSYRSAPVPGVRLHRSARTMIFVPARMYPAGYVANVSGARVESPQDARWLVLAADRNRTVSVTVTPRQ